MAAANNKYQHPRINGFIDRHLMPSPLSQHALPTAGQQRPLSIGDASSAYGGQQAPLALHPYPPYPYTHPATMFMPPFASSTAFSGHNAIAADNGGSMLFSPTDIDLGIRPEMEETFCNNFVCCGVYLPDLHALLQHYEESHVQVEDHSQPSAGGSKKSSAPNNGNAIEHLDVADSLLVVGGEASRQQTTNSDYYSPANPPPLPGSQQGGHPLYYSAFDNTIIRKTGINADYEYVSVPNNALHYNGGGSHGSIARPSSTPASFSPLHHQQQQQQHLGYNAGIQRTAFNTPQSRLAALTANKTNLQLLCSILSGSLEPMFTNNSHNAAGSAVDTGDTETTGADSHSANSPGSVTSSLANSANVSASTAASHHPQPQDQRHGPFPGTNNQGRQHVTDPPGTVRSSNITVASRPAIIDRSSPRPYQCPVPSCGRTYKNPNGLKYHATHGHKHDMSGLPPVERPHRCPVGGCGKKYKNPNGLKYHMTHAHHGTIIGKAHAHGSLPGASGSHHHRSTSLANAAHLASSSLLFSALPDHDVIIQSSGKAGASLTLGPHPHSRSASGSAALTRRPAAVDSYADSSDESHAEFVDDDNGLEDEDMFETAYGTGGIGV